MARYRHAQRVARCAGPGTKGECQRLASHVQRGKTAIIALHRALGQLCATGMAPAAGAWQCRLRLWLRLPLPEHEVGRRGR